MRWMWIDAITDYEPDKRLVAVKNVSLSEEHVHDHFAAPDDEPALPAQAAHTAQVASRSAASFGPVPV